MITLLEPVMIPETRVHVFRSFVNYALWYTASAPARHEKQSSARKCSEQSEAERKDNESVNLRSMFEEEKFKIPLYLSSWKLWVESRRKACST